MGPGSVRGRSRGLAQLGKSRGPAPRLESEWAALAEEASLTEEEDSPAFGSKPYFNRGRSAQT